MPAHEENQRRFPPAPPPKERVDEGSEESFPASDPPSYNPGTAGRPLRPEPDKKSSGRGDTTAQLRHDIDRGRTGSKVRVADPAAAPLGTDDEAAGYSPGAEEIAWARRTERRQ